MISNVTGALTDDVAVTVLMHKYGGLAFWDYSSAAPHVQIFMNPVVLDQNTEGMGKKDAIFFSGSLLIKSPHLNYHFSVLAQTKFIKRRLLFLFYIPSRTKINLTNQHAHSKECYER